MMKKTKTNRRSFFKKSSVLIAGLAATPLLDLKAAETEQTNESLYLVGPRDGYAPKIGTLLSTMTFMRAWIIDNTKELTVEELDFQFDDKSNSIGALLLHLASVERYFQLNTFDEIEWGAWSNKEKKKWDIAKDLGPEAREKIKGNKSDYYLSQLAELREETKKQFAKRDDDWLLVTTPFFKKQPTNNHCKWFHQCEHESNHNGQISLIKKRFPV
jgi:uncharacterized damage-inducible protein DinB